MRCTRWIATVGLIVLVLSPCLLAGDLVESATGKKFAPKMEITAPNGPLTLSCAGVGVRSKFIVKVYALGFYLDPAYQARKKEKWLPVAKDVQALLEQKNFFGELVWATYARRFELNFAREVSAEQIRDAFGEGLEANLPELKKDTALNAAAQKFLGWFSSKIAENDRLSINILPDGGIEAFQNQTRLGGLTHPVLARGITGIWLGRKCISDSLKESLIREFYK